MSTQHADTNKDQAAPSQPSRSIYSADTLEQEKLSPAESFPQPPGRQTRSGGERWFLVTAVIALLALVLSIGAVVIAQLGQQPGSKVTPTPGVSEPAYWDRVLGTQGSNGRVERVSLASLLGNASTQALVTVRHSDANSTLDVYVFDKITNAHPTQLFTLQGLVKGDAKVSMVRSVLTAQVDENSALNAGKSSAQWTADLFREFAWDQGAGTLVQVAFPGIFPDLTRYQAEADQTRVGMGQDSWKNDATKVAQALVSRFFPWKRALSATLTGGGGPQDVDATVRVAEAPGPDALAPVPSVTVQLSRLAGDSHNIWTVTGVADGSLLTLTSVDARSLITSPVKLEGMGTTYGAGEGIVGPGVVYDHLYTDIGRANLIGAAGLGKTPYSTNVVYTSSFRAGVQEGVVAAYESSVGIGDTISTGVLVKVLLNPEPGVVLGPLSCPAAVSTLAYWDALLPGPAHFAQTERVSCGNLLGKPGIQALVTARLTAQGVDRPTRNIYVFDNITSSRPVLLFKLEGLFDGNARISGYSTIMTAQIDRHSSINQGQPTAAMEIDLYREFRWSDGAGAFVQTAFPGIYPDLTRYQAEQDQNNVRAGADSWKNDAAQVAQHMAAQFLKWSPNARASILSGGGPQDVDAVVQVIGANPGGSSINVTLSRLEGNPSNMWVVIGVTSGHGVLTIDTPVKGDRLSSPTTIGGTGSAFEGVIGRAFVLDHLYTTIGQAQVTGGSNGMAAYSTTINYTSSFTGGAQEGVVVVYMYSQANGSIATAAMQKVMLSA